jgi:hypothetical protein
LPQKSANVYGKNPDIKSPADVTWSADLPRWIFKEIFIPASFFVAQNQLDDFGDRVFTLMDEDEFGDHFHLVNAGSASFSLMRTSISAKYECKDTFASKGSKFTQSIINPQLTRDVTAVSKLLAKTPISIALDNTAPAAREFELKPEAKRLARSWIPIKSTSPAKIDDPTPPTDMAAKIHEIARLHERVKAFYNILSMMFSRASSKSEMIIGGKCARSAQLSGMVEYFASLPSNKQYWRPAILLFKSATKQTLDSLLTCGVEKMKLGGIKELLVYFEMDSPTQKLCEVDNLGERRFFVACGAGVADGSFTGDSNLKFAVMHDILVTRVYAFLILF